MNKGADLLLGIDIGTTALKAGLFDAQSGEVFCAVADRLPVDTAAAGQREQQPSELLAGLRRVVLRLQNEVGSAWQSVAGIGLASQGGSAILCDCRTGEALTPMQLWNDTRPLPLLGEIACRRPEEYWRQLSCLPGPGAGLARIAWLRQQYPHLFLETETSHPSMLYAGAGEFIYFALTGSWRQDAGNALQIGCYSVAERALTADPLSIVGVPLEFVAPLRRGHETHPLSERGSRLLGLPAATPVAGPYIDHEAGYLAAVDLDSQRGGFPSRESERKRPLVCSLGTAWVGSFVADAIQPAQRGIDLVLPSPVNAASLILRVMTAGNLTWDWGLETLLSKSRPAALEQAGAIFTENLLPPDGLVSFPWFARPNAWNSQIPGNGGFLGLNTQTSQADLLRALAAGLTFEFASLFTSLLDGGNGAAAGKGSEINPLINCVILGGGASKGTGFQQLLSVLFAPLPVSVAQDQDLTGARGSIFAFSQQAARCPVTSVTPPSPSTRARIHQQFQHYLTVRNAIWPENEDFR